MQKPSVHCEPTVFSILKRAFVWPVPFAGTLRLRIFCRGFRSPCIPAPGSSSLDPSQGLPQPLKPLAYTRQGALRPLYPAPGALPLDPVCDACWICKSRFFRMRLGERKICFHGHNKTKATAGNRASTFRQQPFVFPSASHPVGGVPPPCPWAFILLVQ